MDIMDTFYDGDLKDIWDSDLDPSDALKLSTDADMPEWLLERDVKSTVILNDKLISDALLGNLPIKTENSYDLNNKTNAVDTPGIPACKIDDMEDECYPVISMRTATGNIQRFCKTNKQTSNENTSHSQSMSKSLSQSAKNKEPQNSDPSSSEDIEIKDIYVKEEPLSPKSSCSSPPERQLDYQIFKASDGKMEHECVKRNVTSDYSIGANIKIENQRAKNFGLPPTPPSSSPSDESEGNQSPEHHSLVSSLRRSRQQGQQLSSLSPISNGFSFCTSNSPSSTSTSKRRSKTSTTPVTSEFVSTTSSSNKGYAGTSTRQPIHTPLISSQPKGSTGTLTLTEEEKRTLLAEGYPIPTKLPLTKTEEKALKKIRRKIKNKISAQESRRKKKEYMDQLERKVEVLASENIDYKKKIESLEISNTNLLKQLQTLQCLITTSRQRVN